MSPALLNGFDPAQVVNGDVNGDVKVKERKNESQGGWIIQKFGGTSVGKLPINIAEDIVRYGLMYR